MEPQDSSLGRFRWRKDQKGFGEPPQLAHLSPLQSHSKKAWREHGGEGDLRGLNCFRATLSVYFEKSMYVSFFAVCDNQVI